MLQLSELMPTLQRNPPIALHQADTRPRSSLPKPAWQIKNQRHSAITNALAQKLASSGFSVAVEPPYNGTLAGQQRLDLTFQHPDESRRTGADVTTTTVQSEDCAAILRDTVARPVQRAERVKRTKYETQLKARGMDFIPLATTSNGGLSDAFLLLIKQASRRRARRHHPDEGYSPTHFALQLRRCIAVAIATSTACYINAILDRTDPAVSAWDSVRCIRI
ncbi:uncharacterized protein MONBRDRAFT_10413 [Monosiga brevicollis MX1]|uniref:Uncharacterized protein n=1 Tax=Monosiga brevicollis TaxID=81824 RepID=A9V651_MONBE|nr:uncharacterized protein MONBRDRAFT_10413 [Monosiga brevicollis MX1]EDQ86929.1 predicted protein [Monosiga brevicollis MX1]|eukprot:XP_001748168.1 hypothetical protein [Monosiga brevicollis MX1]